MNNTSKSNSKAKLICIIAGLLVVILAIALAFTFISKPQQTQDTEDTEIYTKQNEAKDTEINQEADTKGINSEIIDSTSQSKEADKSSENIEQAGDMNGDTSEGVEISEELREYNESQVTEEDNTAEWTEEPKQEDVYVPAAESEVDNTPAPAPEDNNSNSNSDYSSLDSDDSFWGSDGGFMKSWDDIPEGPTHGSTGWDPAGGWHY